MKVRVEELQFNPYRNIEKYPVDRKKVEALKISITETSFWDNILARHNKKGYEIAYGHHRLIALQELKVIEVDIPVRDIDDGTMLRIMANENMDEWKQSPGVILETVRATRDFLTSELAKYDSLKDIKKSGIVNLIDLFDLPNEQSFQTLKTKGVGQTTILKFLGGNWKQHMIQDAITTLDRIKEGVIDEGVITKLPSMHHVRAVVKATKDDKLTKDQQEKLVDKVIKQDLRVVDIPKESLETKWKPEKKEKEESKKKKERLLEFDTFILETHKVSNDLDNRLKLIDSFKEELGASMITNKLESAMLTVSLKRLQKTLGNLLKNIN